MNTKEGAEARQWTSSVRLLTDSNHTVSPCLLKRFHRTAATCLWARRDICEAQYNKATNIKLKKLKRTRKHEPVSGSSVQNVILVSNYIGKGAVDARQAGTHNQSRSASHNVPFPAMKFLRPQAVPSTKFPEHIIHVNRGCPKI